MKKVAGLILVALASLCLASCSGSFKDIKVTSCDLVSLVPRGLSAFDAVLDLAVDNPAPQVTLSEMEAVVKMDQAPCMYLEAEDVTISPRTELIYRVTFHGSLDEHFNPFTLLALLQQPDMAMLTMDIRFKGSLKSGLGKHFEYTDIPIKDLLGKR